MSDGEEDLGAAGAAAGAAAAAAASSSSSASAADGQEARDVPPPALGDADEDTLRIMLSTDNHLGYNERE